MCWRLQVYRYWRRIIVCPTPKYVRCPPSASPSSAKSCGLKSLNFIVTISVNPILCICLVVACWGCNSKTRPRISLVNESGRALSDIEVTVLYMEDTFYASARISSQNIPKLLPGEQKDFYGGMSELRFSSLTFKMNGREYKYDVKGSAEPGKSYVLVIESDGAVHVASDQSAPK